MRMECPNCRKRLKVAASQAGKRIRCPQCDIRFVLPESLVEDEAPTPSVPEPQPTEVVVPPEEGILIGTEQGHRKVEERIKGHGVVRMALGGTLILLGCLSLPFGNFFPWTLLASLVCIGQGVRELVWGINAYSTFLVPESFPWPIRRHTAAGEDVIETLLLKRIIVGTYMAPAGLLKRLAVSLVPRFRFLTPAQLPLFSTAGQLCIATAAALVAAVLVSVLVVFHPIAIIAVLVIAGAACVSVLALQYCQPGERNPREEIIEEPKEKRSFTTGNATDLVNHLLRDVFLSIREQERFNRDLWPVPKIESGKDFEVVIGQETEPLLIEERTDVPLAVPVILERAGAGFVAAGWFMIFFLPARIPFINGIAGLPAIAIGWWFLALAFRMRHSFRFVSDIFRLELHGSSTAKQAATEIMGSAGHEQREQLHTSNVYWLLHAARVVTECSMAASFNDRNIDPSQGIVRSLASPRYIVRVTTSPRLKERVETVVQKLTDYRDVREQRDAQAAQRSQERGERQTLLEHRLNQERIHLEQQLRLEGQYNIEQLRQQGRLQEKLLEKMLEGMPAAEIERLARETVPVPRLSSIDVEAKPVAETSSEPQPNLNTRLLTALRTYHAKSNPAEVRLAAKDEFDSLVKEHAIPQERVEELTRLVLDELSA